MSQLGYRGLNSTGGTGSRHDTLKLSYPRTDRMKLRFVKMKRGGVLILPFGIQWHVSLYGIGLYVGCWRWWPTVHIGWQDDAPRLGFRRIGPEYVQVFAPWVYICAYWPER